MPDFKIDEIENIIRNFVKESLEVPRERCCFILRRCHFTNEMMAFFGVPAEYLGRNVQLSNELHPFHMDELEPVMAAIVEEKMESSLDCYIEHLDEIGFTQKMMVYFGVPEEDFITVPNASYMTFLGPEESLESMSYALSSESRLLGWARRIIKENPNIYKEDTANVILGEPLGGLFHEYNHEFDFKISMSPRQSDGNDNKAYVLCLYVDIVLVKTVEFDSEGFCDLYTFSDFYSTALKFIKSIPVYAVVFASEYVRDVQVYMGPENAENGPDPLSDKWLDKPRAEVFVGMFRAFSPEVAIGAAVREYEDYERWMFTAYPAP